MQHIDIIIAAGVLGTTPDEVKTLSSVIGAPIVSHRGETRIEREALDRLFTMLYGTASASVDDGPEAMAA